MDHGMAVAAAGLEQALHARDDLVVHLLHVAGEGIAGPRPGIGEVDADQCRPVAEADAPLEAPLLVDGGRGVERRLQHPVEFPVVDVTHWLGAFPRSVVATASRRCRLDRKCRFANYC